MKYSVDTADLARMYADERLTTRQIAAKVGIPPRTVTRYRGFKFRWIDGKLKPQERIGSVPTG